MILRLLSNPIILTIAIIELCSGFLRQAILQWGRDFSSGIGLGHSFVIERVVMTCDFCTRQVAVVQTTNPYRPFTCSPECQRALSTNLKSHVA